MIKVGLTGNIGSGKSTVAKVFETLGVPVYHADDEAKKILDTSDVQIILVAKFGKKIIDQSTINRKELGRIVFNDPEALIFLNSLIHPLVKENLNTWMNSNRNSQYIIQEAAILFESGFYKEFDKTIIITAPVDLAINRVMVRDNVSKEEVLVRMKNQWPQEKKEALSDFVISNDESSLILPKVLDIHEILSA